LVQISAIYLQQDLSRTFYDTHRWVFEKGVFWTHHARIFNGMGALLHLIEGFVEGGRF